MQKRLLVSEKPPAQEPVAFVSGYYGGKCVILPIDPARIFNSNTALYTTPQPTQQEPTVSKAAYNRLRDDYNELLIASKRDADDAKSWRNHVSRCQFGQVDLDHAFTSPPAQQEPYCWVSPEGTIYQASDKDVIKGSIPMYLGRIPPQRKPLTDERIREIADKKFSVYSRTYESYNFYKSDLVKFVRDIESAHGIKENT